MADDNQALLEQGGLYDDAELLRRVDEDLGKLASQFNVSIGPDAYDSDPATTTEGDKSRAVQQRKKQVEELYEKASEFDVVSGKNNLPDSWQELGWRLHIDRWLRKHIGDRVTYKNTAGETNREILLEMVIERIYFSVIRNSGRWYREMMQALETYQIEQAKTQ